MNSQTVKASKWKIIHLIILVIVHMGQGWGKDKHKTPKCSEPPNVQRTGTQNGTVTKMLVAVLLGGGGGGGCSVANKDTLHKIHWIVLHKWKMRKLPVWNHTFMSTDINFSHPYCIVRFCLHHVKNHTNSLWSQDPYFLFPVSFLQISHGPEAINVNHTLFH